MSVNYNRFADENGSHIGSGPVAHSTENFIADTDSYKPSHYLQIPPGTTKLMAYIVSRGGKFDRTLWFGFQMILKKTLCHRVTAEMVEEIKEVCELTGEPFNYEGWMYIVNRLKGRIPLKIRAVKEGAVVPVQNALATVESTDPKCPWLVSWFETLLLRVWYPTTVATLSYHIRVMIMEFLEKTADDPKNEIAFKLHDFGSRGVSSRESAEIGGLAHLVSFKGTDTIVALLAGRKYYDEHMAGYSIPASEHSTITSWTKEGEIAAYRNMLEKFGKPGKIFACVCDSYDLWNAIENIWGDTLKFQLLQSGATLVVRPDSGEPKVVVLKALQMLEKKFGSKYNSKGFKVLHESVRLIQGDGCNYESIREMLEVITKAGYSVSNITFGMGGMLLQGVNRDTQKFAYKHCWGIVDGKEVLIYKDPIDDPGKRSQAGYLDTVEIGGKISTRETDWTFDSISSIMDIVYLDGNLMRDQKFSEIREIASKY